VAFVDFDASQIEPADDLSPLPAGVYRAMITDSDVKSNKAGTGNYLALTFQVLEGPMANRLVWGNLTLTHPNAQAQDIGQRQLSALCRAVGKLKIRDSQELHSIPLEIRVVLVPEQTKDGKVYSPKNEIKAFRSLADSRPASPPSAAPAHPQSVAAPQTTANAYRAAKNDGAKPWGRRSAS
jgi:hypothetical protein